MCQFVETIRIENGQPCLLNLHEDRMNRTRVALLNCTDKLFINSYLKSVDDLNTVYKLRVVYNRQIISADYSTYKMREVNSLQLVVSNDVDYSYKTVDRTIINDLFASRSSADDILIVKNGLITDTSICNVALLCDGKWYTPSKPLLRGTQRQYLLTEKTIEEREIRKDDVWQYSQITLFNAMIPFGRIVIDINKNNIID